MSPPLDDQKYWLGFSLISGIGPKRLLQLQAYFGSLAHAWQAPESQLKQAGMQGKLLGEFVQRRTKIDLDAALAQVKKHRARLMTLSDGDYPEMLRQIDGAPGVLYLKGTVFAHDALALAIVGTRSATRYGREAAYDLAYSLAQQGVTIVSGLAQGIDAAAHQGALDAGGRTIAVLGSGIDEIYPRDHKALAQRIMDCGAVISEFPIGTKPLGANFPQRNRIISGMALGVLVAEAPENSGALITAGLAAEQGREVFAVPANIYNKVGRGANRLIQDGAKLVLDARDVLEELNIAHDNIQTRVKTEKAVPSNDREVQLLSYLSVDPIHIDELVRLCGLPTADVTSTLTILELKGLAQMVGHMQYSRVV